MKLVYNSFADDYYIRLPTELVERLKLLPSAKLKYTIVDNKLVIELDE